MSVVLHKMSDSPGVEKETTAQKKDGSSFRSPPGASSDAGAGGLSRCRGMRVAPSAMTMAAFAISRTTAHQADPHLIDDQAPTHPSLDAPASDID